MSKQSLSGWVESSPAPRHYQVEEHWQYAVVDLSDNITTVCDRPCRIGAVRVDTVLSAHACPIKDGGTTVFSIPASAAVGTAIEALKGAVFNESLVVDPNDSGTGVITITYQYL